MASNHAQGFPSLTPREREHLMMWHAGARRFGIDAVEDLNTRPWPCPVNGAVIGVFQAGDEAAGWMVVGQEGLWVVVHCADGTLSEPVGSLPAALALICPA